LSAAKLWLGNFSELDFWWLNIVLCDCGRRQDDSVELLQVVLNDSATGHLISGGEEHAVAKWARKGEAFRVFFERDIDGAVFYVN